MAKPHPARSATARFEPTQAGALGLTNRIVMAPLTRNRAGPGLVPRASRVFNRPSVSRDLRGRVW